LADFNIKVSCKTGSLRTLIIGVLEDAENDLTHEFRKRLTSLGINVWLLSSRLILTTAVCIIRLINIDECKRLLLDPSNKCNTLTSKDFKWC
jgi:flagellar biosynthesis regulator FlaF